MKSFEKVLLLFIVSITVTLWGDVSAPWKDKVKELTPFEQSVIVNKATERPFSGIYEDFNKSGIYRCKLCGAVLFRSKDKFNAHCGWPSFDDAVKGAIKEKPDADGRRTEIVCARCGAHLGHIFKGEGFTPKNRRYCVNSVSLKFEQKKTKHKSKEAKAWFAGGCFWGVEYYLEKLPGVYEVRSGYMGGNVNNPTYHQVSSGKTGYYESVEVKYNPQKLPYKALARAFFNIHDPTQHNGQGPDIGSQYRSAVFVRNNNERKVIEQLIGKLKDNGYNVSTKILPAKKFWPAEAYHQNYYKRHHKRPYCHRFVDRFKEKAAKKSNTNLWR